MSSVAADSRMLAGASAWRTTVARSPLAILLLLIPTALFGLSWSLGGQPVLTDAGFVLLTAVCFTLLFVELIRFPQRFGVGALVLYGGVLLWFCHDYLTRWMGADFNTSTTVVTAETVAKAAWFHGLLITAMATGLMIPWGEGLIRLVRRLPEPTDYRFYFLLVLGAWCVGVVPYLLFVEESFFLAIWRAMLGMRAGGATWRVGRTGNVNYNWGAYISLFFNIGQVGGQLAAFYAILYARGLSRLICWLVWLFWMLLAVGTGTRTEVAVMALPVIFLLFLKHQAFAAALLQRYSKRAYILAAIAGVIVLAAIQFQAINRNIGVVDRTVTTQDMLVLQGNSMFSEGLIGFSLVPGRQGFFYDRFPGQAMVAPLPVTAYYFLIGPIPRALWTSKPIDPSWAWYNMVFLGRGDGMVGTTVSQGLVGHWYFRFGFAGVIQGGLLLGWLLGLSERILRQAEGRPLQLLIALGLAAWLFRIFRGVNFNHLYPLIIGLLAVCLAVALQRVCSRRTA